MECVDCCTCKNIIYPDTLHKSAKCKKKLNMLCVARKGCTAFEAVEPKISVGYSNWRDLLEPKGQG